MKSREVFSFIAGLFADGTLPVGHNLWGCAYNIDRYPGALHAAASHGMSEYDFQRWLLEYARRSKTDLPLILPVVVRWGENDRPERTRVGVPLYTMKDFDSLPEATEAALMLELDAPVDAKLYMRDMRAPDVPDVWAHIEVNGRKKEVRFNPLKMWRGEEKLIRGGCDLKQIRVLEWRVVGDESGEIATRYADTPVDATPEPPRYDIEPQAEWPTPQTKQNTKQESWIDSMPKWLQHFFFVLGALFWITVAVKGCAWLTSETPEPPRGGDSVFIMKEKGVTGWVDIGALRTYDRERNEGNAKAARRTLRDAQKQERAKRLPYATSGRVVKVAKKPHDTQDGEMYCVQVDFEEHGMLWVRSSDIIVTEKATPASRPGVGDRVAAKQAMPVFSSKEDLSRMITLAARNNEAATAFLLERASHRQAFILEAGEEVAIIDMDGWLEPYYLVQRIRDNRTGWVLCVAFE